jgi:hypothetical protein
MEWPRNSVIVIRDFGYRNRAWQMILIVLGYSLLGGLRNFGLCRAPLAWFPVNSRFCRIISRFGQSNSRFPAYGNSSATRCGSYNFLRVGGPKTSEIKQFPVIFPVRRELRQRGARAMTRSKSRSNTTPPSNTEMVGAARPIPSTPFNVGSNIPTSSIQRQKRGMR